MQLLRIPPTQAAVVQVLCDRNVERSQEVLLVEADPELNGLVVDCSVVMQPKDGVTQIVVRNDTDFTQRLNEGIVLGVMESAQVLDVSPGRGIVTVNRLDSSNQKQRQVKLLDKLKLPALQPDKLRRLKDSSSIIMTYSAWRKVSVGKPILYSLR